MFRQVVAYRWIPGATDVALQQFRQSLEGLRAIPELLQLRFGDDARHFEGNFDFVAVMDFADFTSARRYVADERHQTFIREHASKLVGERVVVQHDWIADDATDIATDAAIDVSAPVGNWQLTIDCADPALLVRFWAPLLNYAVQPAPDGFNTWNEWYLSVGVPADELDLDGDGADRIFDPTGRGPKIWFQVVPEQKVGKNRLHLDVTVGGGRSVPLATRRERVDAKVAELIGLGATVQRVADHEGDNDHYYAVMHDPEGNEFCVA
jgi:hypothetical protein